MAVHRGLVEGKVIASMAFYGPVHSHLWCWSFLVFICVFGMVSGGAGLDCLFLATDGVISSETGAAFG